MNNLKKLFLISLTITMLLSLSACSNKKDTGQVDEVDEGQIAEEVYIVEVEDQFGNHIKLGKYPERIVSLAPSNTEALFALGLDEEIIGVTSYCNYPEAALEKEQIGSYSNLNLERIIELEPDLIINYGQVDEEMKARLEEANILIIEYLPESIEEVIETIKSIAVITGREEEGIKLTEEMLEKKAEIEEKIKGLETKRVFYEVWPDPLMTAGPGSFIDQLINLANGENIAKDAIGEYPQFDLEELVEKNPQVYIGTDHGMEIDLDAIAQRPGYQGIEAIENKAVYLLDGDILSRTGPRIIEALELLAKAIHPEAFQ